MASDEAGDFPRSEPEGGSAVVAGAARRGSITVAPRPAVDLEVVIPALDEELRIRRVLEGFASRLQRLGVATALVVVDRGSVDATADVVGKTAAGSPVPVHLINCADPARAAAVRRGLSTSRSRYVGYCDVELHWAAASLERVWDVLEEGSQVVVGSRYTGAAGALRRHRHGLRGTAFRSLAGRVLPGLTDPALGFKFFERSVIGPVLGAVRPDRPAFDLQLLMAIRAAGLRIREVLVTQEPGGEAPSRMPGHLRLLAQTALLARRRLEPIDVDVRVDR